MAKGLGKKVLKTAKKSAVKGLGEGVQQRVSNAASGSGSGSGKNASGAGKILLVLVVIYLIFFLPISPVAKSIQSGYLGSTAFGRSLNSMNDGLENVVRSIGSSLSIIQKTASGENVVSFESGRAEVQEETGLSFGSSGLLGGGGNVETFGNSVEDPFGVVGQITVGELDEEIKILPNTRLFCELENIILGEMEVQDAEYEKGVAVFNVFPEQSQIPFHCEFPNPEGGNLRNEFTQAINNKKIILSLTHPLRISSKLETFVLPQETYKQYLGRSDLAFEELGEEYGSRNSRILSNPKFISDVEIALRFDTQPLGVGNDHRLTIVIRNKNAKNKVNLQNLEILFPTGIEVIPERCEDFNYEGNSAVIKPERLASVSLRLSDEKALTSNVPFSCRVRIDEGLLGGSVSPLVKAQDIIAKADYEYTLVEKVDISLRKFSTAEPDKTRVETENVIKEEES